jgi:hypothetical protein
LTGVTACQRCPTSASTRGRPRPSAFQDAGETF